MKVIEFDAVVFVKGHGDKAAMPMPVRARISRDGLGMYSIDEVRDEGGRLLSERNPFLPTICRQLRQGSIAQRIDERLRA